VPEPIHVSPGIVIPEAALSLRAVRGSGPGGQNVNKVASKVELRVDLARIEGLPDDARRRLDALTAGRQDADGQLVMTSQRTRDQHRNLEDAREKVIALVRRALVRPRPRRATKPTQAARQRRLDEKRQASARKRARSRASGDDD
jgi:ribosome-associated protein